MYLSWDAAISGAKRGLAGAMIPALLAGSGLTGEGEIKRLEGLAEEPSSAAAVFHGQGRGPAAATAAVDASGTGKDLAGADLGLEAAQSSPKKKTVPDPSGREEQETSEQRSKRESEERSGKIWGGAVGGLLGLLTGGALAWGIAVGGGPIGLAIVAGVLMAGLGVYIGMDVGKACGPDPECP